MTTYPDRPTLGESYGRATESSDLRLGTGRSDADLLIAAGWLEDRAGALLFRLAREYDGVKGEHGIAQAEFERVERAARELDRLPEPADPKAPNPRKMAERMREDAAAQALTSRAMILIHLKTLREAKEALFAFARDHAQRRVVMLQDKEIAAIAGQALDIHLDPTCHRCQGRGFNGGFGQPQIICKACGGRAKRDQHDIGKDGLRREFGAFLLAAMDRMLARAGGGIGRALRGDETATAADRASAEQGIAGRLDEMRDVGATAD